jgi:hypothetical protein
MTIYAIIKNLDCGYPGDREQVAKAGFKVGDRFILEDVSMGQSHTTVYLNREGGFNSVFFDFEENGQPLNIYADRRFNPYL